MREIYITARPAKCIEEVQIVIIINELPKWSHTTTCFGNASEFMKDPIKAISDSLKEALNP